MGGRGRTSGVGVAQVPAHAIGFRCLGGEFGGIRSCRRAAGRSAIKRRVCVCGVRRGLRVDPFMLNLPSRHVWFQKKRFC